MEKLPQKVAEAYDSARKRYKSFVALKRIHGNFYLYKQTTKWDRGSRSVKTVSTYLGKIGSDGTFTEKAQAQGEPIAAGATPAADANKVQAQEARQAAAPDEIDLKLLTILSMNARADLSMWAKRLNISRSALYARRRALEQRYGIRYTIEANVGKLGFLEYIAYVKFTGERPGMQLLREALATEPQVQLAAITSGEHDMFVYFLAKDNIEVSDMVERLTTNTALKAFASRWSVTPYFNTYGFVPLTEGFFNVLEKRVWRKSREKPRPGPGELLYSEFAVLKELNADGTTDFTAIDSKHNLPRGSSRYTFHRLVERGAIRRVTVELGSLPVRYNAVFIVEILRGDEFDVTKPDLLMEIIGDRQLTNKYALGGDTEGAYGVMFIMPVFADGDAQEAEDSIRSRVKGVDVRRLMMTDIVTGSLCYRRFDNTQSSQHKHLVEDYKRAAPAQRIEY